MFPCEMARCNGFQPSKEIRPIFRPPAPRLDPNRRDPSRSGRLTISIEPRGARRPRRRTRRWRSHPGRRRGRHTAAAAAEPPYVAAAAAARPSWGRWRGHPGWRRWRSHPRRWRGGHPRRWWRSDAGCGWRRPCHVHRRRRRGSPQLRLQLRFRGNRGGGLWRRGGAGWRRNDSLISRAGDAWSRLANGRCGSRRSDGGPGTGAAPGAVGAAVPAASRPASRSD